MGQAFPLLTGSQTWDCKSIAKVSAVRILHLPGRAVVVLAVNGFRDLSRAKEMLYVGLRRVQTLLLGVVTLS